MKHNAERETTRSSVAHFSRIIFGNRHRLTVAAAVGAADPGVVFARQIADETGVAANVVGDVLKTFTAAGLVNQVNAFAGGGVPVLYERRPSCFWNLVVDIVTELEERDADMRGR